MNKQYGLSDDLIARIAQIVQESMMMGIDCMDLMRMIRVSENDSGNLALTPQYQAQVKAMHEQLLADAERLAGERTVSTSEREFKLFKE